VKALRDARLETVAACGHYVEMEKPDELALLVTSFVNSN
jgi:pimeloyl-ACP methyl ester carboxylesterase